MKILALSWEYPPRIIGGISTHVYNLSKCLAKRGVSVHVVTSDFPTVPSEEVTDGVRVSRVDNSQLAQANFLMWIYRLNSQMIEKGGEILATEKFDIIHAHDWLVGRAAIHLKDQFDLPLVSTIHATEVGRGGTPINVFRKKVHEIERLLVRHSERLICCSNFMVHDIQHNLGIASDDVRVIPNGVDVSRFDVSPGSVGVAHGLRSSKNKTILYLGRMVAEKGVYTLLDAFEELKQQEAVSLVFAGEGPLKEDLARECLKRGLGEHVHFTGFVDEQALVSLYKTSDVFVLASHYEPFGIVALEAMASRIPVVVSDVGGLSEVVEDGVTGLKVPPGDHRALAKAILRVLKDNALAFELTENAYRVVKERHDWNLVAERTLALYEEVSEPKNSPSTALDEEFLTDPDLLQLLLTIGATQKGSARSAREIASLIKAPETPVKLMLGRHASRGYVSTMLDSDQSDVRYHLSGTGVIRACSEFS